MAKRRKAPKRAAVSESEDDGATEIHEPPMQWQAEPLNQQPDTEAQSKARCTIDDLEAAVQEKITALLRLADDAAASMNNELRVQLVKIPKQIRLMKLSEFQEKHEGDLTGPALEEIKVRQQALKAQLMPPPATGGRAGRAPSTVTRTTRKTAAPAQVSGEAVDEAPPPARRSARARPGRPPRPAPPSLPTVAEDEEEQGEEGDCAAEPGPSHAAPVPARAGSRQKVMNTPLPGGGSMQTPMLPGWQKAQFGGAFATVVKKAGRGAKTQAGNAIVVTCTDGEQIAVDMLSGLSSVPEERRQEVQQQLTQLKSLAEAALR
ncbi:hypothetical protein WJX82_010392 [Trebouxia sp. C0006]